MKVSYKRKHYNSFNRNKSIIYQQKNAKDVMM